MSETLYVILKNGSILPVTGVTALALDSTLTIKPGDFYLNQGIAQTIFSSAYISGTMSEAFVLTNPTGDNTPQTESWLCSYWKLTRGTSLPILRFRWVDVEAMCNEYPNRVAPSTATGVLYVPLRSGNVAVISGMAASTTGVIQNTSMTIYPGDFYKNKSIAQTGDTTAYHSDPADPRRSFVLNNTSGSDTIFPETWDASHMEFTRAGLLSLYIPERHVFGGPCTSYPNRVAA